MNEIEKFMNEVRDINSLQFICSGNINLKNCYISYTLKYIFTYDYIKEVAPILYENNIPFSIQYTNKYFVFDGTEIYDKMCPIYYDNIPKDKLEYVNLLLRI